MDSNVSPKKNGNIFQIKEPAMNYHIRNFILPIHLLGLASLIAIYYGYIHFSVPLFFLGWTLIYGLGLVVCFHKLLSHNSFDTNRYVKYVLTYFGCLGISGSPLWWAAIHRGYHHAHTDKEKDLQTPNKGWLNSYIGWQFGDETRRVNLNYASDLAKDKVMVFFHRRYRLIVWGTILVSALISLNFTVSFLIWPMIAAHHGENITNLMGHTRRAGYRNFDTNDDTVNNPLLALITWGQLLHNNHHAKPKACNYAVKWYEIDPTMPFVLILKRLKKAK